MLTILGNGFPLIPWQTSWDFNETLKSFETMAAYGVIGGIIGGAIALAITPLLRKKLKKNNKKKGKKSQAPKSYRPWGAALFLFLIALGDFIGGVLILWWMTTEGFNLLYIACSIIITIIGIIFGCWSGSFLGARITISKERLVIEHATKMPNRESRISLRHLGRYHIDVSWYEIRELRADINHMKIILHNDEVYSFPIGWCKDKARDEVARYKRIKPWE